MSRSYRILVLTHEDKVPPDSMDGYTEKEMAEWKTDYDVVATLHNLGHTVQVRGVVSDLGVINRAIDQFKPHICFNLLEEFHGVALYDQHVVSYLELMRKPYTGCNPRGLTIAHDKALSKKILAYHRMPVPKFAVFPMGRKVRRPSRLDYPLLVKSLIEHASLGISTASIVYSDDKLAERVAYIHETLETDAIAEQYIDGREVYCGVIGNQRLQVLPIWELQFKNLPPGVPRIATERVKFDEAYQIKIGLDAGPADDLSPALALRIQQLSKRVYRTLGLTGYARLDWRMTEDEKIYLLEANPNPDIGYGQEFAESAEHAGIDYETLIQRVVNLGLRYRAHWRGA